MSREEIAAGKLRKVMIRNVILAIFIPVILVGFTAFTSALFTIEDYLTNVAVSWQINVFLSPVWVGLPIFMYRRLKKIEELYRERKNEELLKLYKPTVYTYLLWQGPIYSLLASIASAMLGYPMEVVLIGAGHTFGYIGVGSISFMLLFIIEFDKFYHEIPFDEKTTIGIQRKFRVSSFLSAFSGVGMIALCAYTLFWRFMYFPEWELTFEYVTIRLVILTLWISIALFFPNFVLGNYITSSIRQIKEYSAKIREKDLAATIQVSSRDELGIALDNVRIIGHSFREVISQLKENTMFLKNSSLDLKQHAQMISDIANNQAANAEELSASMEEIGSNLELVAESTQSSDTLSQTSKTFIEAGEVSMNETLANIEEITMKVGNVEELAGQTNLLAVNASIEANSAGEYGKGFAVIAREVRALADRSKESASQITELARQCLETSGELKTKIVEVSSKISESTEMASQIANATSEQKVSTDQVNGTVQELNHNAQQLSASAEQLASSSSELSTKAVMLDDLVKGFEV